MAIPRFAPCASRGKNLKIVVPIKTPAQRLTFSQSLLASVARAQQLLK